MPEAAFLIWLHLVGVGLLTPLHRIPFTFRCLTGLPIGVVAFVSVAWLVAILGIHLSLMILVLVITTATVVVYAMFRVPRLHGKREIGILVGTVGLTGLVAAMAQQLNMAKASMDSLWMIEMSSALGRGLPIGEIPTSYLFARPLFLPLLHSPSFELTGDFYLQALQPTLGIAILMSFAWLGHELLRAAQVNEKWAYLLAVSGTAAIGSTYFVVFQLFYINGHLMFAFCLALLVASGWLAAVQREAQWMFFAIPAVIGMVLLRLEGPIIAMLALTPIVVNQRISFHIRGSVVTSYLFVTLVTFGTFLTLGSQGHILDIWSMAGTIAVALSLGGLFLVGRWFPNHFIIRFFPWVLLTGLVLVAALMTFRRQDHMLESLLAITENITRAGQWGATWFGILALLVAILLVNRSPFPALWAVPVFGFLPLTYALSYFRGAYRVGWGDSANRMLTHVLMVAVLYAMLTAGDALKREGKKPHPATSYLRSS